jgi:hypothetical protein
LEINLNEPLLKLVEMVQDRALSDLPLSCYAFVIWGFHIGRIGGITCSSLVFCYFSVRISHPYVFICLLSSFAFGVPDAF